MLNKMGQQMLDSARHADWHYLICRMPLMAFKTQKPGLFAIAHSLQLLCGMGSCTDKEAWLLVELTAQLQHKRVSAELGRFPLRIHFWQQVLRETGPVSCLDKLVLAEDYVVQNGKLYDAQQGDMWRCLKCILSTQSGQPKPCTPLSIGVIIKHEHESNVCTPGNQRSSLKPKAITRFRCGCHGLHADTGRFGRGAQQGE